LPRPAHHHQQYDDDYHRSLSFLLTNLFVAIEMFHEFNRTEPRNCAAQQFSNSAQIESFISVTGRSQTNPANFSGLSYFFPFFFVSLKEMIIFGEFDCAQKPTASLLTEPATAAQLVSTKLLFDEDDSVCCLLRFVYVLAYYFVITAFCCCTCTFPAIHCPSSKAIVC
jgi:hypothetical protein